MKHKVGDLIAILPRHKEIKTLTPDINVGIIIRLSKESAEIYWISGHSGNNYVSERYLDSYYHLNGLYWNYEMKVINKRNLK